MNAPRKILVPGLVLAALGAIVIAVLATATASEDPTETPDALPAPFRPELDDEDEGPAPAGSLTQRLQDRLVALEEREAELDEREKILLLMLTDMELRLIDIIDEIDRGCLLQQEAALNEDDIGEADLSRLSVRVRAMKPDGAAALLSELRPAFAARVLVQIGARQSGRIMDNLAPATAAEIGRHIAALREEP